jgi:very-short-patch-repair endonuclease
MGTDWARLTDFTRAHHGAITWPEAMALGVTPEQLQAWVRARRLTRPAPQVYLVAGLPETWHQRVRVAAGSGAAWASHRTAAALWELDGFDRRMIEVLTVRGRRRKRRSWRVHESRTLRGVDLATVDGIPSTSVPRTLLDLVGVSHPFLVAKALDHACRRDRGILELVSARHAELPMRGRRGARLMSAMLAVRLGTSHTDSDFETTALRLIRRVGIPEPVLQHEVRDGDFVAYLDLAWPDIKWLVECDSVAHHLDEGAHNWDRIRRRHLKRLGWDCTEVTFDDVTKRPTETAADLRALYEIRRAAMFPSLAHTSQTGGSQQSH